MKHSHKIVFAFLLGVALALALTNCSSDGDSPDGGGVSSSSEDGGSSSSELPSSSSSSSAPCGGEYDLQAQRCENDVVETKCGSDSWYNASTQFCSGSSVYNKCNGATYDPQTQFCYSSSSVGDFCGNNPQKSYNPGLYECELGSNGIYLKSGVLDNESKKYKAVLIGTQTWMAEDLAYEAGDIPCHSDPDDCAKYGRLYNWATAMAFNASCNSSSCSDQINTPQHQGICPSGWHVPTDAEWSTLYDYVGGSSVAGRKLKAKDGWNDCGPDDSSKPYVCEDAYGFSALPGGYYFNGSFGNAGDDGFWWGASEYDGYYAYYRGMRYGYEFASWGNGNKSYRFSVRCLQD